MAVSALYAIIAQILRFCLKHSSSCNKFDINSMFNLYSNLHVGSVATKGTI